jgi:GNAT superfamily N-acetyltransferase
MDEFHVEPFDKSRHERGGFNCGQPGLDDFLHKLVTQYEKRKLGKTFVALRSGNPDVVGYYTLAASSIEFVRLPNEVVRKLPKHPIPVILLARLAVDKSLQGQGLGELLLVDALKRSLNLSKSIGIFAVEVLAIDERAISFYGKYGFVSLLEDARHMFLPIRTVEDSLKHRES